MLTENNLCSKCKNFDRYYTKGVKQFNKTEFGWCLAKRQSVNVNDGCDMHDTKKGRVLRKQIKVCLNDLLTELSAIRNIIEAEQNEEM